MHLICLIELIIATHPRSPMTEEGGGETIPIFGLIDYYYAPIVPSDQERLAVIGAKPSIIPFV